MLTSPKAESSLCMRRRGLIVLVFWLLACMGHFASQAKQIDGFVMHCIATGTWTGSCTNEEDGRGFECQLVPGRIITCQINAHQSMECEWISGVNASQAQFWCDQQQEAAMYASLDSELELEVLDDNGALENEMEAPTPYSSEPANDNKMFKVAF